MVFEDAKFYEILNPLTGEKETWPGDRIRCYHSTYGGAVRLAPKVTATPSKRKRRK